jgi:hypothetical protein
LYQYVERSLRRDLCEGDDEKVRGNDNHLKIRENNTRGEVQVEMERSSPMDSEAKNKLLKEIEELKKEIEEVKKRVPPHSVRYEILQLLEEKEEELARKQLLLKTWEERAVK